MQNSYGQIAENQGKKITYAEFQIKVIEHLMCISGNTTYFTNKDVKLCKKCFNQGYTISDTIGTMLVNR